MHIIPFILSHVSLSYKISHKKKASKWAHKYATRFFFLFSYGPSRLIPSIQSIRQDIISPLYAQSTWCLPLVLLWS
jgi:hypothetical protein